MQETRTKVVNIASWVAKTIYHTVNIPRASPRSSLSAPHADRGVSPTIMHDV